jgi:hypothetical protein
MSKICEVEIPRKRFYEKTQIQSPTTLNSYCRWLGIPPGLRYFSQKQYDLLIDLWNWCRKGGRYLDYPRLYELTEENNQNGNA